MHPLQFRLVPRKVVRLARTHTSKPGLVKPTNTLVVVVVKQTQHQWTVALPPLHLQRVSVLLKYQLVLL
jgi:hypothetical protein